MFVINKVSTVQAYAGKQKLAKWLEKHCFPEFHVYTCIPQCCDTTTFSRSHSLCEAEDLELQCMSPSHQDSGREEGREGERETDRQTDRKRQRDKEIDRRKEIIATFITIFCQSNLYIKHNRCPPFWMNGAVVTTFNPTCTWINRHNYRHTHVHTYIHVYTCTLSPAMPGRDCAAPCADEGQKPVTAVQGLHLLSFSTSTWFSCIIIHVCTCTWHIHEKSSEQCQKKGGTCTCTNAPYVLYTRTTLHHSNKYNAHYIFSKLKVWQNNWPTDDEFVILHHTAQ